MRHPETERLRTRRGFCRRNGVGPVDSGARRRGRAARRGVAGAHRAFGTKGRGFPVLLESRIADI